MADKSSRPKTGHGGPGSAAITNDDEYTYEEADNGYDDLVDKEYQNVTDPRSF